jgi:soluble lytic murein transglycosylase-like protein
MMPRWSQALPWNVITKGCRESGLDPLLVAAIVQTESGGNPWASRYEPGYKWLHNVENHARRTIVSVQTETVHQMTSWGLMQIMGAVLREHGWIDHLPKACTPYLNIEFGCRYLTHLKKTNPDPQDMIAAYNAGKARRNADGTYVNQAYVSKVLGFLAELRT